MSDRNDRPPSTRPTTARSPPPVEQLHAQPQSQGHGQDGQHHLADSHDGGAPLTSTTSLSQTQAPPEAAHPPFSPLFTLISNTSSRTTHHPRVHYIFSDDDPDGLDQAIAQQHQHAHARARHPADDSSAVFPPTDRAVVLDLVPSGDGSSWEVAWSSSLSPDWAVLGSRLSRMEEGHQPYAFGHGHHGRPRGGQQRHGDGRRANDDAADADAAEAEAEAQRALMLEIEGVERERPNTSMTNATGATGALRSSTATGDDKAGGGCSSLMRSSGSSASVSRQDPAALVEEFKTKMGLLNKVIRAGEDRPTRADLGPEVQGATTALHADSEAARHPG